MSFDKGHLKVVIADQAELMAEKLGSERIVRREGISKCKGYLSSPNILLISGVRRAGKSFFSHLLVEGKKCPFISFDDERLFGLTSKDLNMVLECFYELYSDFDCILLDEIQNIDGWELFVNRLRNKYRLIVTGSNANLLSSELATHLTGRFVSYPVFPLSFREYLVFNEFDLKTNSLYSTRERSKISEIFSKYQIGGGIFEYYKFGREYLRTLFSSIITKDIVVRYKIKYPAVIEELALLLINYFASKISVNKFTSHLKIKSFNTTKEYIRHLENSFLMFTVNKFSYKIKEQLSTLKKVYVIDNGLIESLTFSFSENKGRFLENVVAVELRRRSLLEDFEVYYWDNYNVECDFIVKKGRKITSAYQVTSVLTLGNREREVKGLLAAMEYFKLKEGTIITESTDEEFETEGFKIKVVPAWKWLVEGNDKQ